MDSRIRVVRIFSRLNVGGPSIHVVLLDAGLNRRLFQSTLVVGSLGAGEGDMHYFAEQYGVTPVEIPSLGRDPSPLKDLKALFALVRLLRRIKPHVVHTHTSKAGFSGRIAARLSGVPVVVHTFHGHVFHGYFHPLMSRLLVLTERILARGTTAIIAVSEQVRRELAACGVAPLSRIRVVELGLPLEPFLGVKRPSNVLRAELCVGENVPLVGVVGRLTRIKDHRTFLEAASLVSRERPDARFVIVGDGELAAELKLRAQREDLDGRVFFLGWRRQLAPIYADLDVVVVSSRNEGTPVSIVEGAAAGCPVVATRVGGVPDLIEHGFEGLLVSPGQPPALADAIARILREPEVGRRMASRARDKVRTRFAAQRMVADIENLYLELISRHTTLLQPEMEPADPICVRK
jgi:glycosyltransferase involved in cell wall biosynthesis